MLNESFYVINSNINVSQLLKKICKDKTKKLNFFYDFQLYKLSNEWSNIVYSYKWVLIIISKNKHILEQVICF